MNSQISLIQAQSHQQDLSRAAARAHLAAGLERQGVLSKGAELFHRVRWTRRSPKTAPAAQSRVTVA